MQFWNLLIIFMSNKIHGLGKIKFVLQKHSEATLFYIKTG